MENKNISEGLQELIYKANTFAETAAEIIIAAYRYAIDVDHLEPLEAAKVLKENLVYSPQWIRKQLPDEAKHIEMRRLPSKIANAVSQTSNIVDVDEEPESEYHDYIHNPELVEVQEQPALAPYTATDDRLHLQNELDLSNQLLTEERAKTAELEERLQLQQNEHEAREAKLQDKITELDLLTDKLTDQLQQKSQQLTALTMQQDNEIEEPPAEQNYSIETDVPYNGKKIPVVVRCFISGRKVGWIDRDVYKARYGREPQEE